MFRLMDQGTFYLDILGNICFFEQEYSVPNYAYIMATALSGAIDLKTELKLFNSKGEIVVLRTASRVKLDGVSNILSTDLISMNGGLVEGQFITYTVNSSNEVTIIDRANTNYLGKAGFNGMFAKYGATASSEFSDATKSLSTNYNNVYLTENTVIMVAYGYDEYDYQLVNVDSIADGQIFSNVTFYNVNSNREVGAVLINAPVILDTSSICIAVVSGINSGTNVDGDDIVKIKALQNGELKTLNSIAYFETSSINGESIIPIVNMKGEVASIYTLAVPDPNANIVYFTAPSNTSNVYYLFGIVTDRISNIITTTGGEFIVPLDANVYIYDECASSTNRVTIGDISNFNAELSYNGMTIYDQDVVSIYAIAREYNGKIIDVVIYIFK